MEIYVVIEFDWDVHGVKLVTIDKDKAIKEKNRIANDDDCSYSYMETWKNGEKIEDSMEK